MPGTLANGDLETLSACIRQARFGMRSMDYFDCLGLEEVQTFRDAQHIFIQGVRGILPLPEKLVTPRIRHRYRGAVQVTHMGYEVACDFKESEALFRVMLGDREGLLVWGTRRCAAYAQFSKHGPESVHSSLFGSDEFKDTPAELFLPNAFFLEQAHQARTTLYR